MVDETIIQIEKLFGRELNMEVPINNCAESKKPLAIRNDNRWNFERITKNDEKA